jgi:hypothetical protein
VEILASQGAPLVSMTLAADFATSVVDNNGKFAAGVNDTGGNLLPVSMTPAANNGNNISLLRPEVILKEKMYLLPKGVQTK